MPALSIILPAYNEESRLPKTFDLIEAARAHGVFSAITLQEILIVDDGSKDRTIEVSEARQKTNPLLRVVRVQPNQGKGNAIHEGLKQAKGDWCLVADADSATPWDQFLKLYSACVQNETMKSEVAIGSRDLPDSDVTTQQSWVREHMGKTFNLIVRLITGLPYRDTQCGFKLIHRASIQKFLPTLQIKRFAWDVEFLMFARAYGLRIKETPVSWAHQDESRVNPIKDSLEMLIRVLQLRLRIWCQTKK